MNHCAGGTATDAFDAFGAVVDWVERGISPDRIVATARANNPDLGLLQTPIPTGRTRPLCPYPAFAHFNGALGASIDDAASFDCRPTHRVED